MEAIITSVFVFMFIRFIATVVFIHVVEGRIRYRKKKSGQPSQKKPYVRNKIFIRALFSMKPLKEENFF
jgi:hypothetical protein